MVQIHCRFYWYLLHPNNSYNSLHSRRFQKLARGKRNSAGGSVKNKEQRDGGREGAIPFLPTPSPFSVNPPHFSPPLFRSLVRSPPGKGKETAATQATVITHRTACYRLFSLSRNKKMQCIMIKLRNWDVIEDKEIRNLSNF